MKKIPGLYKSKEYIALEKYLYSKKMFDEVNKIIDVIKVECINAVNRDIDYKKRG